MTHPNSWRPDKTSPFLDYVVTSQQGGLAEDYIFQFLGAVNIKDNKGVLYSNPESLSVQFPPDSRFYVCQLMNCDKNDLIAHQEVLGQLPRAVEGQAAYDMFTGPEYAHMLELFAYSPGFIQLLNYVVDYKRGFPRRCVIHTFMWTC
ncbi:hypothetical protein FRC12_004569 [Ceratobasidium sp. 428]|nr:hypothetical protein FRC12_004569 [Ceratobasidium sp. 428]